MVNFGPLAAEIGSLVWSTPANFNGFRVLAALLNGTQWMSDKLYGVDQTAPPIFGRQGGHHVGHSFGLHSSSFLFGSVQQIKLAIRQLLGACKYFLFHRIVSYRIVLITTTATGERLQRDCATSQMKCWYEMRRFMQRHSQGVSTPSSSLYCSVSPDTLQPVYFVFTLMTMSVVVFFCFRR